MGESGPYDVVLVSYVVCLVFLLNIMLCFVTMCFGGFGVVFVFVWSVTGCRSGL